jgi:hypothetical protein
LLDARAHQGLLHRHFCNFAAMGLFDAYRIICPVAANAGAGQTGRGQEEPEVRLQIHTHNLAKSDKP